MIIGSPFAIIITGVRRCGKSTFLMQLMQEQHKFYYISFEDIRLSSFEPEDFEKLDEVFNDNFEDSSIYFFDEIQNVPKWELFIRQKLDEGNRIVIAGSNASLLSRELGTRLVGRHLDFEMFPIFVSLRKKRKEIFYFKQNHECDFVIKGRGSIILVIQCLY